MSFYNKHLFLCTNQKAEGKKCCANQGGAVFVDYLKSKCQEAGIYGEGKVRISSSGCMGRCALGPCVVVYPEGIWYHYQNFSDLDEIIQTHLIQGKAVTRLLIDP